MESLRLNKRLEFNAGDTNLGRFQKYFSTLYPDVKRSSLAIDKFEACVAKLGYHSGAVLDFLEIDSGLCFNVEVNMALNVNAKAARSSCR